MNTEVRSKSRERARLRKIRQAKRAEQMQLAGDKHLNEYARRAYILFGGAIETIKATWNNPTLSPHARKARLKQQRKAASRVANRAGCVSNYLRDMKREGGDARKEVFADRRKKRKAWRESEAQKAIGWKPGPWSRAPQNPSYGHSKFGLSFGA